MSLGLQLAVPIVCSRCILAKCEFFNKQSSSPSIMHSVDGFCEDL